MRTQQMICIQLDNKKIMHHAPLNTGSESIYAGGKEQVLCTAARSLSDRRWPTNGSLQAESGQYIFIGIRSTEALFHILPVYVKTHSVQTKTKVHQAPKDRDFAEARHGSYL